MEVDGLDSVLDFHRRCSELIAELSKAHDPEAKRAVIRRYIESQDGQNGIEVPEFDSDAEWFNVSEPLSLLGSLKGKVLVLDFFTYCCINCMHVLPDLEALETVYTDTDGLVVIGIHSAKFDNEKLSANILSAVLRYNITHPVINDVRTKLWIGLNIHCWPTLVVVSPHGRAVFAVSGEGHRDLLMMFVAEMISFYEEKNEISHDPISRRLDRDSLRESALCFPGKICCSPDGRKLAISDTGHNRIILTDINGIVQSCVGGKGAGFKDGCYKYAQFNSPQGICFRNNDEVYIADTENHAIRKIDLEACSVITVAGTGYQGHDYEGGFKGTEQALSSPWDVIVSKDNPNVLLIAMAGTHQIWTLFLDDTSWIKNSCYKKGVCVRFAGSGNEENRNNTYPHNAGFAQPSGITVGKTSAEMEYNTVFVADSESSAIRAISLKDGAVKGVVGGDINPLNLFAFGDVDGKATQAKLQHPLGVDIIPEQGVLLVADSYNHKIKMVNPLTRSCTTIVGSGKPGHGAGIHIDITGSVLNEPGGLAVHPSGDRVYIADTNNHCIKQLTLSSLELTELPIIFMRAEKNDVTDSANPDGGIVCPFTSRKITLDRIMIVPSQELYINLDIHLPNHCHFNEEAPNKWVLFTKDVELQQAISGKNSGEIISLADCTICKIVIPEYREPCIVEIEAECTLHICTEDDTCMIRTLVFVLPMQVNTSSKESSTKVAVLKSSCDLVMKTN